MKKLTHLSFAIILTFISISANAQVRPLVFSGDTVNKAHGQNSNLYSQITDIFQAAIHDGLLKNGNNELQLTASVYALQQLFSHAKKTFTDQEYINSKDTRNINISIITGFDNNNNNNNRITTFSPSVKFSLLNRRDPKNQADAPLVYRTRRDKASLDLLNQVGLMAQKLTDLQNEQHDRAKLDSLQKAITQLHTLGADTTVAQVEKFFTDKGISLNKADVDTLANVILANQALKKANDELVAAVAGGKLITFQGGSLFKNNGLYGMNTKLEFLVGTGWKADKDKPWDFDAYLSANLNKDSTAINPSGLNRQVYSGYVGLNKVLLYTEQQPNATAATQSLLEIKGSAGADYIPNVKYQKENEWNLNLDFVLSVRLAGNLYMPIEIKYAPAKDAFLGLFKLQYTIPTASSTK